MSGLSSLRTPGKVATGRGVIPSIWRGSIVEAYDDGTVAALVPNLLGDQAVRMPCVVADPAPGDAVLIAAVEGRVDDLIVIAPG